MKECKDTEKDEKKMENQRVSIHSKKSGGMSWKTNEHVALEYD
jgi:hypothetical protein